jgi:hypothetical protein
MASFYGHISTSSALGVAVGAAGFWYFQYDWGTACLAAGLTAIGGMLPDLDSDSGIPVREIFGFAGFFVPLLLLGRLQQFNLTGEQMVVILAAGYLVMRFGVSELFKRITVHRGMYHSIPAMLIAGLVVFLIHRPDQTLGADEVRKRLFFATGTMIGFLSHLVLDELFAVDLMGVVPKLNQFAGSAVKLKSDSWIATGLTYAILCTLSYFAWVSVGSPTSLDQNYVQTIAPMRK